MSLSIDIHEKATTVVTFSLEGSLDTSTYLMLERRLNRVLETDTSLITFDMQGVEYMSSAGVRVILKARKAMKKRGGHVFLLHLQPQIRKVLAFINQLPSLEVYPVEQLDMYLDQIQREETGENK
jgi:anti-anti-sigma factor